MGLRRSRQTLTCSSNGWKDCRLVLDHGLRAVTKKERKPKPKTKTKTETETETETEDEDEDWDTRKQALQGFDRMQARPSGRCQESLAAPEDQLIGGVSRSVGRFCWAKSDGASMGADCEVVWEVQGVAKAGGSGTNCASCTHSPPRLQYVVGYRPLLAFGIQGLFNACHALRNQTAQPPTTRASTIS